MLKHLKNKRYFLISLYACAVAALTIIAIFIGINLGRIKNASGYFFAVITPVVIGMVIAYLINPIMRKIETRLLSFIKDNGTMVNKTRKMYLKRVLALTLTYLVIIALIAVFLNLIVPQIANNYHSLVENMGGYINTIFEWAENILGSSLDKYLAALETKVTEIAVELVGRIGNIAISIAIGFFNFILGLILSFFILLHKEHIRGSVKKSLAVIFTAKAWNYIVKTANIADRTFGRYIVGQIFDALTVGTICFVVFWIFKIPYFQLISMIVCVTNVIPYFGPFIGGIPSVILVFIANEPIKALLLALLLFIIQQIDGNFICPKIIGNAIGSSSLMVIIAITVMGQLLGFVGMVIGVPIFSVLCVIIDSISDSLLRKKKLSTDLADYYPKSDILGGVSDEFRIVHKVKKTDTGPEMHTGADTQETHAEENANDKKGGDR